MMEFIETLEFSSFLHHHKKTSTGKIKIPDHALFRIPREHSDDTACRAGNKEERVFATFCLFLGQISRGTA